MMTDIDSKLSEPSLRASTIKDLGKSNHPMAISYAIRYLHDQDYETRIASLDCLSSQGYEIPSKSLAILLDDDELLVRTSALEAVANLKIFDLKTKVIELTTDPSELVRAYAAWCLSRIGDSLTVEHLIQLASTEKSEVVQAGIMEALCALTNEKFYFDKLIAYLLSQDPEARSFASNSLVGIALLFPIDESIVALTTALSKETHPAIAAVLGDNLDTIKSLKQSRT